MVLPLETDVHLLGRACEDSEIQTGYLSPTLTLALKNPKQFIAAASLDLSVSKISGEQIL